MASGPLKSMSISSDKVSLGIKDADFLKGHYQFYADGLPDTGFAESYVRNVKALVQVDKAQADQRDTVEQGLRHQERPVNSVSASITPRLASSDPMVMRSEFAKP